MQNLHMDPVQLRTHIRQQFDTSSVTSKQIYYWWSTFCQRFYKSNDDHVVSARQFLKRSCVGELCFDWSTDFVTAIGFTTPLFTKLLSVSNIHCDATYKTAKGRFELYGIIGNVEGAGFPMAYLILNTTKTPSDEQQTGLRTKALSDFFHSLRDKGLQPQYFYTDKDFAEINATKEAWPNTSVQLCQWHMEKAIKEKLKSHKRIRHTQYQSNEAADEFDFIDLSFKPDLKRSEPEYYIVCPPDLQNQVIDLVRKHFNMHPKIPVNAAGQFLTANEIRKIAVNEIYKFCFEKELVLLWAYLWSAWYKKTRWTLWARSTHTKIPLGKTNNLIESHWRVVKHCYLYQFNRPRLDYLVWIICSRLLPDQLTRYNQICSGRIVPSWFGDFKNHWRQLATRPITKEDDEHYFTDLVRWICSCPSFLGSRFLICKHLIYRAIEEAKLHESHNIRLLYNNFQRREDYPFLVWNANESQDIPEEVNVYQSSSDLLTDVSDDKFAADGDDEDLDPEMRQICESKVAAVKRMAEHLEQELAANNLRHVLQVVNNMNKLFIMLDNIETAKRKRYRNLTWRGSTPWTLFLQ